MRVIGVLGAVVVALLVAALVTVAVTGLVRGRERRLRTRARWRVRHYGHSGHTVVAVSLTLPNGQVIDEHVIDRLPDADREWSDHFLRAQQDAEERAFHLNEPPDPALR